jgi:hypothetical protein
MSAKIQSVIGGDAKAAVSSRLNGFNIDGGWPIRMN